jgi:hypothetical protein
MVRFNRQQRLEIAILGTLASNHSQLLKTIIDTIKNPAEVNRRGFPTGLVKDL